MLNVFSFELKRLLGRISTFVFLAFILLSEGLFIIFFNFYSGVPGIETSIEYITLPLLATLPMICIQAFSGDKKYGRDIASRALGITPVSAVLGRFLAISVIFAVSALPIMILPAILAAFANINATAAAVGIIGYLLFGLTLIAISLFISAVTPSPLFASIFTYVTVIAVYVLEIFHSLLYLDLTFSFFLITVVAVLLALSVLKLTRSEIAAVASLAVMEIILLAVRFISPSALARFGTWLSGFIAFRSNLAGFCYGLFDISAACNLLLLTALMLTLCVFAQKKEKFPRKSSIRLLVKSGVSMALAVIICAGSVLIPSAARKSDLTKNKMYTLGELSDEIVTAVDKDVTLYLIAAEDTANSTIKTILERYSYKNSKIKVALLDPNKDATEIAKYTSEAPEANSVLAVCGESSKLISYYSMFYYSPEAYMNCYTIYYYYMQAGALDSSTQFPAFAKTQGPLLGLTDGYQYEMMITSAIQQLTGEAEKKLYMMLGHGETGISEGLYDMISLDMYDLLPLTLDTSEIPEDADCILLMPTLDITENEYTKLSEYLQNGGKLALITGYSTSSEFKNLLKLTNEYGLNTEFNSCLCEDTENYFYGGYQNILTPDVSDKAVADLLEKNGSSAMIGNATGITVTDTSGVNVTPIFTSSPKAYGKIITADSTDISFNEETDTRSTYYTGVHTENESGGELIWLSSAAIAYDEFDLYTGKGNKQIFMHILNTLSDNPGHPDIAPKMVLNEIVEAEASYIYTLLAIFVLLAAASGAYGFIRYKKK